MENNKKQNNLETKKIIIETHRLKLHQKTKKNQKHKVLTDKNV